MTSQANDVLQSALSLGPAERGEIAASLIASLESSHDHNVEAAWAAEIERRIESIDAGEVRLIPAEEVMRAMRERLHD